MKKFKLVCLDTFLAIPSLDEQLELNKEDIKNNHTIKASKLCNDDQSNSRRLSTVRGCMKCISHNLGGQNLVRRIEQFTHDFEQRQSFVKKLSKSAR